MFLSEPSIRQEELKKKYEDKYSEKDEDATDSAGTNIAVRRRAHNQRSQNSLQSLSMASLRQLNSLLGLTRDGIETPDETIVSIRLEVF